MIHQDFIRAMMRKWKEEANVTSTVLFSAHSKNKEENDDSDIELVICTNRPGPFIGRGGHLIDKYRDLLERGLSTPKYQRKISIKFIETEDKV